LSTRLRCAGGYDARRAFASGLTDEEQSRTRQTIVKHASHRERAPMSPSERAAMESLDCSHSRIARRARGHPRSRDMLSSHCSGVLRKAGSRRGLRLAQGSRQSPASTGRGTGKGVAWVSVAVLGKCGCRQCWKRVVAECARERCRPGSDHPPDRDHQQACKESLVEYRPAICHVLPLDCGSDKLARRLDRVILFPSMPRTYYTPSSPRY
jgi:hypothetical protein